MEKKAQPKKHENQLEQFLEGMKFIFRSWTALRLCIDSHLPLIYENIVELVNDNDEIVEELQFNVVLGTIYEEICKIIKNEKSGNFQEKTIAVLLKKFIQDFFFVSLEDESDIDIARMIVKLFNEISNGSTVMYERWKNFKHSMEFNSDFPCKVNSKVKYNESDYEEDDESAGDVEDDEEVKEILEGKYKATKKTNANDLPPELLEELNDISIKNKDQQMDIDDQPEDDEGFEEIGKKKKKTKK